MSSRTPAGDKGTADRIEADDGGYWVRLVTKQAMLREGECMKNCLRDGSYSETAGDEDLVSESLWSLRKSCGTSYMLAEIERFGGQWSIDQLKGPCNDTPSEWSVRQLRYLRAAFKAAGEDLLVPERMALVGEDGMTYRPDAAPLDVRELNERLQDPRWRTSSAAYFLFDEVDDAPQGTPFRDMGSIGPGGGDPYFALTRDLADPVIRVFHRPHDMGHRCVTRSGIQFDVRPDALSASGRAGPSTEAFLRIYNAAIERAARARPPEQGEPEGPHGGDSQGSMQALRDARLRSLARPIRWDTLLTEQAAERASYERLGITLPRPVPTVAIGIDTQPQPAPNDVETVTHHARVMVDRGMHHSPPPPSLTGPRAPRTSPEPDQARRCLRFVMLGTSRLKDTLSRRLAHPGART